MNCGGQGRWPLLGMTPMVLLVLGLYLQGSASRCIDTVLGEDLQPLPPNVQRCSLPSGLLQPDVAPPGQGGGSNDGGDTRIVGGRPVASGSPGGGSSDGRPTPQGGNPFSYKRPIGNKFGGRDPGQSGSGTSQYGVGPVQYGGNSGIYRGCCSRGPGTGYGTAYNRPQGFARPEWKNPGIPYVPSPEERGGNRFKVPSPISGGGANSYNTGGQYPSSYSGGIPAGPRGRYDGSYGPVPSGSQYGNGPSCNPNC